jgi:hypothetical protein
MLHGVSGCAAGSRIGATPHLAGIAELALDLYYGESRYANNA